MKPPVILLCCIAIAGCSFLSNKFLSNKMSWAKANTPAAEAQADLDTCEALAHEQTKKDADITQDINAASGSDSGAVPSTPDMQGYQSRQDYNQVLGNCMAGLGYTKAP